MAHLCQPHLKAATPARMSNQSLRLPPGLLLIARVPLPVWILVLGASALLVMPSTMLSKAELKSFAARHDRQSEYLCEVGDLDSCRELSADVQPH